MVIDDGSTDDTAELARGFAGRLPRLQVISTANGGIGRARNAAIAASTAPIIAPVDADDVWHPTYLEKMTGELAAHTDAGFVYCPFRRIDMQSHVTASAVRYEVRGCGFYQLVGHNYVASGSNAVFWRRHVAAVGGYDPNIKGCEDIFLLLLLAWRASVWVVPEYLVGYRDVPGSVSKRWRSMANSGLRMCDLLEQRLPAMRREDLRWSRGRRHLAIAHKINRYNDGTATDVLWHSLLAFWFSPKRTMLAELRRHGQLLPPNRKRRRAAFRGEPYYAVDPATDGGASDPSHVRSWLRAGKVHDRAHAAIQEQFWLAADKLAAGISP